jgi:hypothetical protein
MRAVQALTNSTIEFAFESMHLSVSIDSLIEQGSGFSTWMAFNHAD